MNSTERPIFFYLFRKGRNIEIVRMTDLQAGKMWDQGERWLDVPHKTFADAQEVRKQLLSSQEPH
jgi:hypothetical protein